MLTLLLALACNGDDQKPGTDDSTAEADTDTDTDADTDTDTDADADADTDTDTDTDSHLTVFETPTTGSGTELSTCYGFDEGWKDRGVNPDCEGAAGKVWLTDFETGDAVEAVMVDMHAGDGTGTEIEASDETNANGRVNVDAASCRATTWVANAGEGMSKTITQHVLLQDEQDLDLVQMSQTTTSIIPSLLGVTVDEEKGIVMGRVMGCLRDPVQASQVFVRNGEGAIEGAENVYYFVDNFPRPRPSAGPAAR